MRINSWYNFGVGLRVYCKELTFWRNYDRYRRVSEKTKRTMARIEQIT